MSASEPPAPATMPEPEAFDVLIVGGGPVGGCAGALLASATGGPRGRLRVALLTEVRPQAPAAGSPLEARVSALSRSSERILMRSGAWSRMRLERACAYERMRVWHESFAPDSRAVLTFDAADVGEPNLGHIIENQMVQAAVLDAFESAGGELIRGTFGALTVRDDAVRVRIGEAIVRARLVIGADGARSSVRDAVGLTADIASYRQTAIVANVATERSHERTAWQRFLRKGTLAFLPLADGSSSIVWSADDAFASVLLGLTPGEFEQELRKESDGVLGAVRLLGERLSFPLQSLSAHRYTAHRCALVGDAAHVVHPLAGQGVNLGLLDAAVLAEEIAGAVVQGEDPGADWALRRYERRRKGDIAAMSAAIEAFDRLLAHGASPLARLAQRGLGWVNLSSSVKRVFIRQALGLTGDLPRAARA